jgi:arsenite methyltransferase
VSELPPRDRWADWLLRGRYLGADERVARAQDRLLERVRDRVIRGAKIRGGNVVLDVGSGTGLLALAARRKAGPEGLTVASDISTDALLAGVPRAASHVPTGRLVAVGADQRRLPFADFSFDVVMTRSVLIYVPGKREAVGELHRVLRAGGRVSMFEPINTEYVREGTWPGELDLSELQPAHDEVTRRWEAEGGADDTLTDFDEKDLASFFLEAGFRDVALSYEWSVNTKRLSRGEAVWLVQVRPNPNSSSYAETARDVLGEDAAEYLGRYLDLLVSKPLRTKQAVAYVTAKK